MGAIAELQYRKEDLDAVFGKEVRGHTPVERAAFSEQLFVRSQVQITFDNPRARGLRLLASEALRLFGWDALLTIARDGAYTIVSSLDEPADTIRKRRELLAVDQKQVAHHAGVSLNLIKTAETPGEVTPIRDLQKISQYLSLDETKLGTKNTTIADDFLGVRLRKLAAESDHARFSAHAVLMLSEAAWVIDRQHELSGLFAGVSNLEKAPDFGKDNNYSHPAWKQGYRLAAEARAKIGIDPIDPIENLKDLIENKLNIPVIQQSLDARFAGATLANNNRRGIVVNESGNNSNVWIRRMTICHELGHLLFDPDQKLNKLKVDTYNKIDNYHYRSIKDGVEERANAFAVAFLAPPDAVRYVNNHNLPIRDSVSILMNTYGISMSAAKHHFTNITNRKSHNLNPWDLPTTTDEWNGRENFTADWFPVSGTPLSRRGRFSVIASLAYQRRIISADTASMLLNLPADKVEEKCAAIIDAYR